MVTFFQKSKATLSNISSSFNAEHLGTIEWACLNIQAVPLVNKAYINYSLYKQNADGYTMFYMQWQELFSHVQKVSLIHLWTEK